MGNVTAKLTTSSRSRVAVGLLSTALTAGCIKSPVWRYGTTKESKATQLQACPGGLLDDGEDGNHQI